MSVLTVADEAIRCLQQRRTEVRAQIDQFALIEAEIDGMTDVLELQEALHQCVRLTNEVLQATQKVLEDSIAIALVNRETAEIVAALQRRLAGDQAVGPGRVVN
jgi:type I restriction-modification system DNA methylase subunit